MIIILNLGCIYNEKKEKSKYDIDIKIENMEFTDKNENNEFLMVGNKFLIVELTIKNIGNTKINFNPRNITITDNNNTYFYFEEINNLSYCIESLDLDPNVSINGFIIFEIPLNTVPDKIVFKDLKIEKSYKIDISNIKENFNKPPIANAGNNQTLFTDTIWWKAIIEFNSNGSWDPDGNDTIESYKWDFGDGNISFEKNPIYTYNSIGTYRVVLTVIDDFGLSGNDTISITIKYPLELEILNFVWRLDKPQGSPYIGNFMVSINMSNFSDKNITINGTSFIIETTEGEYYNCCNENGGSPNFLQSGDSANWTIGFEMATDKTPKTLIYENHIFTHFSLFE